MITRKSGEGEGENTINGVTDLERITLRPSSNSMSNKTEFTLDMFHVGKKPCR
jgi:hypothetical protein